MTKEERKEAIGMLENAKNFVYDEAYTKAFDLGIEALEQEPCEDAVSRKAVKDAVESTIAKYIPTLTERQQKIPLELARAINKVLSVIPTREHGEWIFCDDSAVINLRSIERIYHKCSKCGHREHTSIEGFNFCPCCGAYMRENK